MSNTRCHICNNVADFMYTPMGGDGRNIYHCSSCDTVFTYPMVSDNEHTPSNSYNARFGNLRIGKGASLARSVDFLSRYFPIESGMKVFDVGVNRASFMRYVTTFGVEFSGIEPDFSILDGHDYSVFKDATIDGNNIRRARIEDYTFRNNYDLIYLSHTLEHVDDPVTVLRKLARALTTDGRIYIEVPNIEIVADPDIVEEFFINKHRYHFSVNSLVGVIERAGLSVLGIEADLDAICVLCGEASDVPTPVKSVDIESLIAKYRRHLEINHTRLYKHVKTLNEVVCSGNTIVWGAGRIFSAMVFRGLNIDGLKHIVDTYMRGMEINGIRIESPSIVDEGDNVIICAREHYEEIEELVLSKEAIPYEWI